MFSQDFNVVCTHNSQVELCWIQSSIPNPKPKATTIKINTNPSDIEGLGHVSGIKAVISRKIGSKP